MRILLRKCYRGHSNLFEWSVTGKTWYPINGKKIVPQHNGDADPFKALEPFRNAMNQMLKYQGFFISVWEAEYDKTKKVLRLKKNA